MIRKRTKQQIAFDGVRTAWHNDAFTQILHEQVTTKFSMDGVVPSDKKVMVVPPQVATGKQWYAKVNPIEKLQKTQKKLGGFVGTMDGVRMPFKQARA